MKLQVQNNDFLKLHIEDELVEIEVPSNMHASLYLTYDKVEQLSFLITINRYASLKVLLQNDSDVDVMVDMKGNVYEGGSLNVGLLEVEKGNSNIHCQINLKEPYAKADVMSATLAQSQKEYKVDIIHECRDSEGIMNHYAIVQDDAKYTMKASGIILKGASGSASHQKTRVLTMTKRHRCKVDPILLIDEDEVKASHAMTLGQMDENQLYYLMSRGLTRQQALGLLSAGYLMPICNFFENEEVNASMKEEMEKKVGLYV